MPDRCAYEIEFDFAHLKLNLYEPDYCDGNPVTWTQTQPAELNFPLDQFGSVTFTGGSAVKDGQNVSIGAAGGKPVTMIDFAGNPIAAPSALSSDESFVRRAYENITGTLPTPSQVKDFLADDAPNKRDRELVPRALSPVDHPAGRWCRRL